MDKIQNFMENKVAPIASKVAGSTFITCLMDGFSSVLGLILIGSIASLITGFQYFGIADFLEKTGIKNYLSLISTFTNGSISLLLVFTISTSVARKKFDELETHIVSLISVVVYFILSPLLASEQGMGISMFLLGARGMFVAMIVAFIVPYIYSFLVGRKIVIRMPSSVPPFIEKAFKVIIPATIIFLISIVVAYGFAQTSYESIHGFIYSILQKPFTAISSNIHGYILITFLIQLFWFFGIHGGMTFDAIKNMLFTQAALANVAAYGSGQPLENIVTIGFSELAGSGWAQGIGLLICMIFFCKREDFKIIGKVSMIPQLFKISEPVRFGVPTVFNFTLMIPLLITQPIIEYVAYFCCKIGILSYPRMASVGNVPVLLSGFLQGGVSGVVFQIFAIVLAVAIFLPFVKMYEKQKNEEDKVKQSAQS
jgi:PTS system, lactose/cellobiose family IIC component